MNDWDQLRKMQKRLFVNLISLFNTSYLLSSIIFAHRHSGRWKLQACCLLCLQVSAVDSLEGPLLQVEGLGDLRLELHSKKLNIHLVLIDELHRHLYIKSTSRVGHRGKDKDKGR